MKQIRTKIIHSNPWLTLSEDTVLTDDNTKTYYTVSRPDSVILIPITPSNKLILVRVYRYPTKEYSWEFPCGAIEKGESALDAARREMHEETGIQNTVLRKIGSFHPLPALTAQYVSVYSAQVSLDDSQILTHEKSKGEIEKICTVYMKQLANMINNGEITDGLTLCALQILLRNQSTIP